MKTKILLAVALFALLVLGTAMVFAADKTCAAPTPFEVLANGIIHPLGNCNRFCSWCTLYGHNGACTTAGGCC